MAINWVQFQRGLSFPEFLQRYGTEAKCYRAIYKARWPHGFRCPQCGGRSRARFRREGRVYYQCRRCRHQTTLGSGTLLAHNKLPLRTWLLAMYLLTTTKTNLAALELMRHLGVNWKTAWRLKHKVLHVMATREATRRVDGYVQIDDAYLGGERNGGKVGRGAPGKQPMVAAVETDADLEHPRYAVLEPVRAFDNVSLDDWYTRRLAPAAEVYSDGLACFAQAIDTGHAHSVLVTGGGRAATQARGARWVNVIFANAKRAISGRYHAFKHAKYARLYLGESQYRFNRRFDLAAMVPRLLRATMLCAPCAEPMLCAADNFHS
ncbi:MAG TPA: IS1595 family transposase [Rhodanobacteraceae bacterium]